MSQLALEPLAERKLLLIGNPNVGKSLLFGCLTNRYVTVSNYPGTTVELTTARATIAGEPRLVVDTPGTNGLIPQSDDERVSRDLLITSPDADVVQVGDMSNLRRTLLLSLQIVEHEIPFTLCLNMTDEARERDSEIDPATIAATLGIPVVATSALRRWNLERLKREAVRPAQARIEVTYADAIEQGIGEVLAALRGGQAILPVRTDTIVCPPPTRGIALSILAGDETLIPHLPPHALERLDTIRADVQRAVAQPLSVAIVNARLAAVDRMIGSAAVQQDAARGTLRDWIGAMSMHPLWGVPILLGVLYVAWLFVGKFGAGTLVDLLESKVFEEHINVWAITAIEWLSPPQFIRDLLVGPYGVITMALTYAIAIVLPVVMTFFLFFGVLEDSGYLPRLAVMLNRIFRRMGLNGKAVLPMVLGLGCDTMATLTTRILETKKEATIVTLLLALGVPCSAQLGVIMAMLGPLAPSATLIWLGVTLGTIFVVGFAASRVVPGRAGDFILEIPPVRVPKLSNIVIKVLARTEWYLKEAVPLFIVGTLLLFVLDAVHLLGKLQRLVAPVVVGLLGLPAEAANAFLIGFLRRDYGAAGLFAMQQAGNLDAKQTVVALTTITLFIPCIANFLVILKERGTRAGLLIAAFILAYAFAIGGVLNLIL
ncbi:MAG TPA: ferrous iron transport protein B [Thermoanaerobaculia bacterium]|nr:ferrous iron transport protein B [Thermoanaerobaculia bacterium]